VPKFVSPADPASRWTGANGGLAFFAYCTNYLIDLKHAVIVDVEATTAVRQAEVTAQQRMIDRTQERLGLWPERLAADAAHGSAKNLAWLVQERGIEPHIPVFDNQRSDGTFSRDDFTCDHKRDCYICPAGRGPVARAAGRLNLQGGASVSLTQHTAVKGVCEGRCFVAAIEPQAQNGAIELKTVWHDPASV
jgi:hypothetical protein